MRKQAITNELALYTFVFKSRISKAAVLSLFTIMCIQPVSLAYAAEDESVIEYETVVDTTSVVTGEIDESSPPEEPIVEEPEESAGESDLEVTETGEVSEEIEADGVVFEAQIEEEDVQERVVEEAEEGVPSDNEAAEELTSVSNAETQSEVSVEVATSTESEVGDTASSTDSDDVDSLEGNEDTDSTNGSGSDSQNSVTSTTTEQERDATATSTDTGDDEDSGQDNSGSENEDEVIEAEETSTSTSTEEVHEVVTPVYATAVNDTNFYQFSKTECVTVGDGSFYCGATDDTAVPVVDAFFAAQDSDGDLEIFARKNGQEYQITHNVYDDAAPHYDATSETIVWHRLINDRYQIMSYDFGTERETQLTNDSVNNMEPTRFGDITVWQQWGGNSWEIILLHNGKAQQLTNNIYHDIAPSIRSGYVLWKTVYEDVQQVSVYDIETGEVTLINDAEASISVSNPRMVLMYDALTDAGDVVTRGYDPKTGEIIPLGVLPTELPDEMPESDQTGETRALIQTKSTTTGRENGESENDDEEVSAMPDVVSTTELMSEIDSSADDVIIPPAPEAALTTESDSVNSAGVYVEDPLVVPVSENSSSTKHIPTLVIPPATTTESQ